MSQNLDFMNLMAYDFNGWPWSKNTGNNAPLNDGSSNTIVASINFYCFTMIKLIVFPAELCPPFIFLFMFLDLITTALSTFLSMTRLIVFLLSCLPGPIF